MRAFLAADSSPSRRRRSTSCSSWCDTGPGYQNGASHHSQGHHTDEETGLGNSRQGQSWEPSLPMFLTLPG